ncbi:MAG: hypothetical protein ABJ388_05480 [Alphaproteobacteria bacterium]
MRFGLAYSLGLVAGLAAFVIKIGIHPAFPIHPPLDELGILGAMILLGPLSGALLGATCIWVFLYSGWVPVISGTAPNSVYCQLGELVLAYSISSAVAFPISHLSQYLMVMNAIHLVAIYLVFFVVRSRLTHVVSPTELSGDIK